jgi:hypothetical protein
MQRLEIWVTIHCERVRWGQPTVDRRRLNPASGPYTHPGRCSSVALAATINGTKGAFNVFTYQASGEQLSWLDVDANGVWLGPLQQQGSLTGLP